MKPQRMANWPPLKSCCSRCLASLLSFGMPAAGRERGAARPRTSLGGGGRRSEGTLPGAKSRSLLGGGGRGPPSSAPGPFLCPGMPLHAAPCRGWKRQRYTDACSAPKRWWRWKFVACSLLLRYGQLLKPVKEKQQSEVKQHSTKPHQMLSEVSEKITVVLKNWILSTKLYFRLKPDCPILPVFI